MGVSWRIHALRALVVLLVLTLILVFQTAVFSFLSLYGVHPDLILIAVISLGYLRGPVQGTMLGAVGGLFADLLTGQLIGLGAVVLAIIGGVAGFVGLRLVREKVLLPVLFSVPGTALHMCMYAAGAWAFGIRLPIIQGLLRIGPPLVVYNMLAMVVMHPLLVVLGRAVDRYLVVPRRPAAGN